MEQDPYSQQLAGDFKDRYGSGHHDDPRTPEQRKRDEEQARDYWERIDADLEAKKAMIARWNEIGQYLLINGYCLPFVIDKVAFPRIEPREEGAVWSLFVGYTDLPDRLGIGGWNQRLVRDIAAAETAPWREDI